MRSAPPAVVARLGTGLVRILVRIVVMVLVRIVVMVLVMVLVAVGVSCGSDAPHGRGEDGGGGTGAITVFAAASLTAAYTEIGDAFVARHPDATVTFNFASSSDLVTQIDEGAPADVFASADQANMTRLVDAGGNAGEPMVFATNRLQIIVERGNPTDITGVADLGRPDVVYVTCAPGVPIGAYAAQVLANAGVRVTPASLEENVKGIVAKVTLGEADAGIVYVTDVIAAGEQAGGVAIPAEINVVATYPLVVTREAPNAGGARAFVDFVRGEQGREILAAHGFATP